MSIFKQLKSIKSTMYVTARTSDLLKEITPQERERLQAVLFDAYKDIKRVCDKHGLNLFLVEGSAIGVVRHQGFIPWDDDIDVGMSRKDYLAFLEVFEEELGDKYALNSPNYSKNARNRYPILMIKDSYYRKLIDTKDPEMHRIPLDIFIVDNVPDNKLARKIKGHYCNFLEFIAGQVFLREVTNADVKAFLCHGGKAVYNIRMLIGFLFSFRSSSRWFDVIDRRIRCRNENSRDCGILTARKHYFGEILPRQAVFPPAEGVCNGETVQVFHDVDRYLRTLYGDYWQIPPEEKRERHFFCELRFPGEQDK